MKIGFVSALLALLGGLPAQAQAFLQSETKLYDQSIQGQTAICGLDLTFVFRDDVTGSPNPGGMSGSVSFAFANGSLMSMVKVNALKDFAQAPVISASLSLNGDSLALKRISCFNGKSFCGAAYDNDAIKVVDALGNDKLEIRYNLRPGDIDFAIPVSTARAQSAAEKSAFTKCMVSVLGKARSR